jgi:hypothetical protein
MREHVLGKSRPAIAERERRFPAVHRQDDVDARLVLSRLRVDGVLEEIVEYLPQTSRLALNENRRVGEREGDMRAQIVV